MSHFLPFLFFFLDSLLQQFLSRAQNWLWKWTRSASSIKHPDRGGIEVRGQSTPILHFFFSLKFFFVLFHGPIWKSDELKKNFVVLRARISTACRVYQDHYWNAVCAVLTWISHRKWIWKKARGEYRRGHVNRHPILSRSTSIEKSELLTFSWESFAGNLSFR